MVREYKDLKNKVLDHYVFITKDNDIGVIVGNAHTEFFYIGYIKYVMTDRKTIWCNNFFCYERVIRVYEPNIVHKYTYWRIYIPYYGSEVPIIPLNIIKHIYEPQKRALEILSRCEDNLERIAASFIEKLYETGVTQGIGITGSLLPGIHNPRHSDLDFVIYGTRESIKIIEFIEENPSTFRSFSENRLKEWVKVNAKMNKIPLEAVGRLYRRWRRGVYSGKEYSIIYNNAIFSNILNKPSWVTLGKIKIKAEIEPSISGLNYPSIAKIYKWHHINGIIPKGDISNIISFEALYIPLFFEGGKARVEGLLQYSKVLDEYRILIGVKEYLGKVIPL
ncbi:MAG: hypothetical protein J7L82_01790 [Staphylothermus sp.]|nr:hypothetical protein [Staphylothermus sp.]